MIVDAEEIANLLGSGSAVTFCLILLNKDAWVYVRIKQAQYTQNHSLYLIDQLEVF